MDHTTIISKLEDLLPEIKSTQDPAGVMLKYARENNLSPAQLQKLGQVYNIAKTLTFMDKSASRGGTFSVLDTEDLLNRFSEFRPAVKASRSSIEDWCDAPEDRTKAASLEDWTEVPASVETNRIPKFVNGVPVLVEESNEQTFKLASFLDNLHSEAELEFQGILKNAAEIDQELMDVGQLIDDQEDFLRQSFTKLADHIRINGTPFSEVEQDCLELEDPVLMKAACNTASNYLTQLNVPHSRGEASARPHLARDRHGLVDLMKAAAQALDLRNGAIKYASSLKEPPKQKSKPKSTDNPGEEASKSEADPAPAKPDKAEKPDEFAGLRRPRGLPAMVRDTAPEKAEETQNRAQKETFDTILGSIQRNVIKPGQALVDPAYDSAHSLLKNLWGSASKPRANKRQQLIDESGEDTLFTTALHRLLTTDPILSKADPQNVASLAHSIRSAAPDAARDPNFLRFALREALQYDAVPLHTYKDLTAMQELRTKTDRTRRDLERERYATNA